MQKKLVWVYKSSLCPEKAARCKQVRYNCRGSSRPPQSFTFLFHPWPHGIAISTVGAIFLFSGFEPCLTDELRNLFPWFGVSSDEIDFYSSFSLPTV
jgi:hypothetical protein